MGTVRFCWGKIKIWIFLSISVLSQCNAWDADGHQAIGMTAMSALSQKAATQVKRLMGGKDVVDVAGWAHKVEQKHAGTSALHFALQPTKWSCDATVLDDVSCPDNQCIVRAIQHFYGRLTGRPDLVPLQYPDNLPLTDSDAVKFLINLLGDLHQPLHLGFLEDFGGQNISLVFSGADRTKTKISMYNFWNEKLIQKFISERPSAWYGGWTHVHTLGSGLRALTQEWEETPEAERHLLFEKWAAESLSRACTLIYKDQRTGSPIASGFEVLPPYEYLALETIKTQLLTAGARTAFVLNSILAARDVSKLRQGSAIQIALDDGPASLSRSKHHRYLRSFCINIMIVTVVLVSIFPTLESCYESSHSERGKAAVNSCCDFVA